MATTAVREEPTKLNCGSESKLNMTKLRGVPMANTEGDNLKRNFFYSNSNYKLT